MNFMRSWMSQFPLRLRSAGLLSFVVLLESIQILLLSQWITDYLPLKNTLAGEVLPEWLNLIRPEREMLLFHIFIAAAVLLQVVLFGLFHKRLGEEVFYRKLRLFAGVEACFVFSFCARHLK